MSPQLRPGLQPRFVITGLLPHPIRCVAVHFSGSNRASRATHRTCKRLPQEPLANPRSTWRVQSASLIAQLPRCSLRLGVCMDLPPCLTSGRVSEGIETPSVLSQRYGTPAPVVFASLGVREVDVASIMKPKKKLPSRRWGDSGAKKGDGEMARTVRRDFAPRTRRWRERREVCEAPIGAGFLIGPGE